MTSGIGVKRTPESYRRHVRCSSCPWFGARFAPSKDYAGPLPHPCKECGGVVMVTPFAAPREERFWSHVDKSGGPDACWQWTHTITTGGYGSFSIGKRKMRNAHILAYEWTVGPVPDGKQLDHTCHTFDADCPGGECAHRRCVNPGHLEPVTIRENTRRGRNRGRFREDYDSCIHGHEMTDENSYIAPDGLPKCRECRRAAGRAWRLRRAS